MIRTTLFLIAIVVLGITQVVALRHVRVDYEQLSAGLTEGDARLPAVVLDIMSVGNEGLFSDHLFLRALAFLGGASGDSQNASVKMRKLTEKQWVWFEGQLEMATDLDPWFMDPYYVANSSLTWDAKHYTAANHLLEKGTKYRDWDWILPFYAGFNAFYFLGDTKEASRYLMIAANRPGGSSLLATLAARLSYEGNQTGSAIIFLRQIIRSGGTKYELKPVRERLKALEGIYAIEQGVTSYRQLFGHLPLQLEDLISTGMLTALPEEPYGGYYYLDLDGVVKSSTDFGKHQ